jgi:hypothetical protein
MTMRGYVRAAKRSCCHESPHDAATDPHVRPFHTVSEGVFSEVADLSLASGVSQTSLPRRRLEGWWFARCPKSHSLEGGRLSLRRLGPRRRTPCPIRIRNSTDAAHQWSSSNIEVSSTVIRPDEDENGVYVNDPGATGIRLTNNNPIAYTPPKCGILLSEGTPVREVTISGNTFLPDEPTTNVCYPITSTPTESSVLGSDGSEM